MGAEHRSAQATQNLDIPISRENHCLNENLLHVRISLFLMPQSRGTVRFLTLFVSPTILAFSRRTALQRQMNKIKLRLPPE
jgi:hypothetical protein